MCSRPRSVRSQVVILLAGAAIGTGTESSSGPKRRPSRQVQLLSLSHQAVSCEWVSVLTAEQRPYLATPLRLDHVQARAIAVGPDELLVERRHKLTLMVQDFALVGDEDSGVPDAAETGMRTLVEANVGEDLALSTSLLQSANLFAVNQKAFTCKTVEEAMVVYGSSDGGLSVVRQGSAKCRIKLFVPTEGRLV